MKVGICGTHCSGKTTLAHDLADAYGLPVVERVADAFPRENRASLDTQFAILDAQIAAEVAAGADFVSDRTVMDNAAYISWHARQQLPVVRAPPGNVVLGCCESAFTTAWHGQSIAVKHMLDHPYDLVVFVNEFWPPEDNGTRSLDPGQQVFVHDLLKKDLPFYEQAARLENVMTVRGDRATRLDRVGRAVLEIWDRPVEEVLPW